MAQVISEFRFEHPQWQEFLTKTREELRNDSFYNVMRWYIGSVNINYALGQLTETLLMRDWLQAFIQKVVEQHGDQTWTHFREGTFCASGKKASGVPFVMTNFMDGVCQRYHYVVRGSGTFTCVDDPTKSVSYKPGSLLCFDAGDYDKKWCNTYDRVTEQVVLCLGRPQDASIKNWELFSAFQNKGRV